MYEKRGRKVIDEQKVSLMTKLAIFEKHEKRKGLVISKYYRSDYVRFNVLKTLVAATVVYWLVVAAYVFMNFEDLLAKVNDTDYFSLMYKLLGWYVGFCFIYFIFSTLVYEFRYYKARKKLTSYNSNLKDLIELEGGGKSKADKGHIVEHSQIDSNIPLADGELRTTQQRRKQEPEQKKLQSGANAQRPKSSVSKVDMVRRREEEANAVKQQEILANVQQRNARLAAKQEEELQRRLEMEEERKRIQEKRRQIEKERMEQLRNERMQQTNSFVRENHNVNNLNNPRGGKQ